MQASQAIFSLLLNGNYNKLDILKKSLELMESYEICVSISGKKKIADRS
jgi:hypothetical protein